MKLRKYADTNHESAAEWYSTLGYHVDDEERGGSWTHPICEPEDLEHYDDDDQLYDSLRRSGREVPSRQVAIQLILYARGALVDALTIESLLQAAVEAYERGDLDGVVEALEDASSVESRWGDDPATQQLRAQLLDES